MSRKPKVTIYRNGNEIIAVSRYAGKNVRAVAKCNPNDEFDADYGIKLATDRLNMKVAIKKFNNAVDHFYAAKSILETVRNRYNKLSLDILDIAKQVDECRHKLEETLDK